MLPQPPTRSGHSLFLAAKPQEAIPPGRRLADHGLAVERIAPSRVVSTLRSLKRCTCPRPLAASTARRPIGNALQVPEPSSFLGSSQAEKLLLRHQIIDEKFLDRTSRDPPRHAATEARDLQQSDSVVLLSRWHRGARHRRRQRQMVSYSGQLVRQ